MAFRAIRTGKGCLSGQCPALERLGAQPYPETAFAMGTPTTTSTNQRTAIEAVVQLYIDGASRGDAAKLKEAFHERGWMFGHVSGQRFDAPFTTMIQELVANPLDSDGGYRGRIVSVEQTGDGAVATVEESGCWGNLSFVDYFTLAKVDGVWKIVNKVFVHTSGEMPTS